MTLGSYSAFQREFDAGALTREWLANGAICALPVVVATVAALGSYVLARHGAMRPPQNITDAEIEAMRLVKSGHRLKQIAYQLGVTEGAVKQRLKNARLKLNAKTGAEAISRAAAFGLI